MVTHYRISEKGPVTVRYAYHSIMSEAESYCSSKGHGVLSTCSVNLGRFGLAEYMTLVGAGKLSTRVALADAISNMKNEMDKDPGQFI